MKRLSGPGLMALAALLSMQLASAQAPASPAGPRLLGTVVASSADTVTLKLENGGEATVAITAETKVVRTAPGAKTLAGATVIHAQDLAPGDRILVRATPGADATHFGATAVIAMKQADIAQAQQQSDQDWQRRGVSGVVKSVDTATAAGSLVLGTSQPGRTVTVQLTPKTIVRRYSPDSVKFADAKMSTLDQIHPGDQLRARGDRNGDSLTAEEIVAGTFRNIAGTVTAVDAAANTLTLTDLATKKPVTLTFNADTQARMLPPEMAQRIAARFKAAAGGAADGSGAGRPGGAQPSGVAGPGRPGGAGAPEGSAGPDQAPRGDLASQLQRAPSVTLAELKKGDAVMVVATQGTPNAATAITLLAGVDALLQASASASRDVFSASWNLGGTPGGAEAQ